MTKDLTIEIAERNGKYIVVNSDVRSFLERKGFGNVINNELILDSVEVAYLSMNNKIIINGKYTTYSEIVHKIENFAKFIVYLDLRRRGYPVKAVSEGPVDLVVWSRGKSPIKDNPSFMIKVVDEGLGIRTLDLVRLLKYCESMGVQLVLALVSSEGVITYYKAFSFKK